MEPTVTTTTQNANSWTSVAEALATPYGVIISLVILTMLILAIREVRKGIIQFKGFGLTVGNAEKERNIIRQQVEWVHTFLESYVIDLGKVGQGVNPWRTKYVVERVYDEVVDWITFNHITDKGDYIKIKQDKVWFLIKTLTIRPEFQTDEFRKTVDDCIDTIIRKLISIRKLYADN